MKSTILITCVLACTWQLPVQGATKPAAKKQEPAAAPATADGQAEAIRKYPELGKTGSSFNVEFISRVKRYQKEKPDLFKDPAWPIKLADEVAESGKVAGPGQKAPGNAAASKTVQTTPASKPAGEPVSLDKPRWIGKGKLGKNAWRLSVLDVDLKGDLFVSVPQEGSDEPSWPAPGF